MFARQFKPKITKESQDFMVEEYRRLRQRDTSGGTTSSWRITVRQLESMIRLSEGMARLHCQDEVQPKHVKEAFRLLNMSIIRVEQPVINFDEDDQEPISMDDTTDKSQEKMDTDAPSQEKEKDTQDDAMTLIAKKKAGMHMSFEDYKQTSNLLVLYMRQEEEKEEEGFEGVRKSALVNWYLKEMESEIESEAELIERKTKVEKIIDRLVNKDHIIIELSKTGLTVRKSDKDSVAMVDEEDALLVVHPNYNIEI